MTGKGRQLTFMAIFLLVVLAVLRGNVTRGAAVTTAGDVSPWFDEWSRTGWSEWDVGGDLFLGPGSAPPRDTVGFVKVYDGARVTANAVRLNGYPDGVSPSDPWGLLVWGSGSTLMSQSLEIYTGKVELSYAGRITSANAFMALDTGRIAQATVTGSDSLWENSGSLYVGYSGDASMVISGGGRVTDAYACIAYEPGSTAIATVTGSSSLWHNSGNLYVAGGLESAGGTAVLNVSNGGTVQANQIVVWHAGTIGGNGTLRAGSILNHGTVSPGNSIGTLTVEGDFTFEQNSVLEVEVDNSGNGDKLLVTGDVTIHGGTVKAISTETITGTQEYTIVDASSVTGTFDALDTALLHVDMVDPDAALAYTEKTVLLRIVAVPFDAFDFGVGRSRNQRAVGLAFQDIAEGGGNTITHHLQQLPTLDDVRHSYGQLSGQNRPPLAPVTAADSAKFVGTVSNRLQGVARDFSDRPLLAMARPDSSLGAGTGYEVSPGHYTVAFGNGTPYLADRNWGVWGKLYGLYGDRETENGTPGYTYEVFGQSFGLDYQFTERFLAGFTGGFSNGDVDYAGLTDRSEIDGKHIGVYGSYDASRWYVNSVLTYSSLDFETRRVVDLMAERLEGDFDGDDLTGHFEAGVNWEPRATWLVQPLASFQFSYLNLDGYAETGGASALVYADQDYESFKGSLGARVTKELMQGENGRNVAAQVRGRWVHEFGDTRSNVNAYFATDPGVVFTVSDEDIARNSAVLGTGISARLGRGLRLFVDYDTSLNADNTIHVISGAAEYRW